MPSKRSIMQQIDRLEPKVARAFREAMREITSNAKLGQLEEAIKRADIEAAVQAMGVSNSSYGALTEEVRSAFVASGNFWAADVPKRINFGFDVTNPRAERWIRENGAELIARDIQHKRTIIQETIESGIAAGKNPRSTALDLAGRIDRRTGRRVGGQITLSNQQAGYVRNAASELRQNTDRSISQYLSRKRRDRRFDGTIRKALASGKELSEKDIARITGRYSDRLLQTRAETIARTETLKAFNQAADESMRQLVQDGYVKSEQVRKTWDATMDMDTRPTHADANGQTVAMDEPFIVGGYEMMHPHDSNAPASETVDCRCFMRQDINFITDEAMRE